MAQTLVRPWNPRIERVFCPSSVGPEMCRRVVVESEPRILGRLPSTGGGESRELAATGDNSTVEIDNPSEVSPRLAADVEGGAVSRPCLECGVELLPQPVSGLLGLRCDGQLPEALVDGAGEVCGGRSLHGVRALAVSY